MQCLLAGRQQLSAVGQTLILFVDLLIFTLLRSEVVQLFQLILQQLAAGFALLRLLLMQCQGAAALMPGLIAGAHLLQQIVVTGIGIQQMFLVVWFEQKLMGMLAVDLNQ